MSLLLDIHDSGEAHAAYVIGGDHVEDDVHFPFFHELKELYAEYGHVFLQHVPVYKDNRNIADRFNPDLHSFPRTVLLKKIVAALAFQPLH